MQFKFSGQIFENIQISNFLEICQLGAELFHEDGRTDGQAEMTEPTVAFLTFANAPNSSAVILSQRIAYHSK